MTERRRQEIVSAAREILERAGANALTMRAGNFSPRGWRLRSPGHFSWPPEGIWRWLARRGASPTVWSALSSPGAFRPMPTLTPPGTPASQPSPLATLDERELSRSQAPYFSILGGLIAEVGAPVIAAILAGLIASRTLTDRDPHARTRRRQPAAPFTLLTTVSDALLLVRMTDQ